MQIDQRDSNRKSDQENFLLITDDGRAARKIAERFGLTIPVARLFITLAGLDGGEARQ